MTQSDITRTPGYTIHLRQATDNAMAKAEKAKAQMGQGGKYVETRPAAFVRGHWIWAHPFTMQVFDLIRVERGRMVYWEARAGSGDTCYAASTIRGLLDILNKNAALTWADELAQELYAADLDEADQIELDGTQAPEPAHERAAKKYARLLAQALDRAQVTQMEYIGFLHSLVAVHPNDDEELESIRDRLDWTCVLLDG